MPSTHQHLHPEQASANPTSGECDNCGASASSPTTGGGLICLDCLSTFHFHRCGICRRCLYPSAGHPTDSDHMLCSDCATSASQAWHPCHCCHRYTRGSARTDHCTPTHVCGRCLDHHVRCRHCGRVPAHPRFTHDGAPVCRCCLRRHGECRGCDTLVGTGETLCPACEDVTFAADVDPRHVYDYSFKPRPVFHGEGPLFLGMELEIETPNSGYNDCVDAAGQALKTLGYLKSDSSIHYGFELVTHPMSYDYAISRFPWQLLSTLERAGCFTRDETGLHVHVSRSAFTGPAHAYRWMKFIYRNQTSAVILARRSTYYAEFNAETRRNIGHYAKGDKSVRRNQAINTQPTKTFEVRIFRSSLNVRQVQAALAFVAASVAYTGSFHAHDVLHHRAWDWDRFIDWLGHHPEYAPLRDELQALAGAC